MKSGRIPNRKILAVIFLIIGVFLSGCGKNPAAGQAPGMGGGIDLASDGATMLDGGGADALSTGTDALGAGTNVLGDTGTADVMNALPQVADPGLGQSTSMDIPTDSAPEITQAEDIPDFPDPVNAAPSNIGPQCHDPIMWGSKACEGVVSDAPGGLYLPQMINSHPGGIIL